MWVLTAIGTTGAVPGSVLVVWLLYLIRRALGWDSQVGDRLPSCAVRVRHLRPLKPGGTALHGCGREVMSGSLEPGPFLGGSLVPAPTPHSRPHGSRRPGQMAQALARAGEDAKSS